MKPDGEQLYNFYRDWNIEAGAADSIEVWGEIGAREQCCWGDLAAVARGELDDLVCEGDSVALENLIKSSHCDCCEDGKKLPILQVCGVCGRQLGDE